MAKTAAAASNPTAGAAPRIYEIMHSAVGYKPDGSDVNRQGDRVTAADLYPGVLEPEPLLQRLLDIGAIRPADGPAISPPA